MKRWQDWSEYRSTKLPAPEHGIKVKKAGTTWWGQRWISALEHVLQGDARRLERGRSYARAGRAHDLEVSAGKVTALVTGTRPEPYRVQIELSQLSDEVWQQAIRVMAARAQFSAELLAGELPRAIDEAFRAAGGSLFPVQRAELVTRCSCPDWGDPCKHVAATHYVLGEAFDRDPFLLFELRGRSRERVLFELRRARSGQPERAAEGHAELEEAAAATEDATEDATEVAGVALSAEELADYERPRAPLPALRFSFDVPNSHAAVLRQLGRPGSWRGEGSPADAFAPSLQRAAEVARRLALRETELESGATVRGDAAPADDDATAPAARRPPLPAPASRGKRSKRAIAAAQTSAREEPPRAKKAKKKVRGAVRKKKRFPARD